MPGAIAPTSLWPRVSGPRPSGERSLLDTCALLSLSRGDLPFEAYRLLREAPEAWVSSVSAWEVALKAAQGKLDVPGTPGGWFDKMIKQHGLHEIPLAARVACAAAALPAIHKDPFDRVIVALGQARDLTILTSDENIRKYPGIRVCW